MLAEAACWKRLDDILYYDVYDGSRAMLGGLVRKIDWLLLETVFFQGITNLEIKY